MLTPMWKHYCANEGSWISVETGATCNWCNAGPARVDAAAERPQRAGTRSSAEVAGELFARLMAKETRDH